MRFEYELTRQDYIDFNVYHLKNSSTFKRSLFINRYLTALLLLIAPIVLARVTYIPLRHLLAAFAVIAALWVILYPRYCMSAVVKRISEMVDEGKNRDILGKHCLTIDEEGITERSENGDSRISWAGVERMRESERHFFIYIGSAMAYILPKSILKDENAREEFSRLLSRRLGGTLAAP